MDSSQVSNQFKQVIDVSSLYPSINSYWASYVACSGWFSPSPPQNKLICFNYAVLLFVVEWRQNMKSYIGVKPFTEQKTICKVERQSNRFSIEFIFF